MKALFTASLVLLLAAGAFAQTTANSSASTSASAAKPRAGMTNAHAAANANPSVNATASANTNASTSNPDGMIVTEVPSAENELPAGTPIWVRLQTPLYSNISHPGETFSALVSHDVSAHGKVMIPMGAKLMGRVVYAHDGNRWLLGKAKIRLRPEDMVMPDGTHIPVYASIVDTDRSTSTRTDDEGTITAESHPKRALISVGAGTATGAGVGALAGGPVGAAVGGVAGAGAGTGYLMMHRSQITLPMGTELILELTRPMEFGAAASADTTTPATAK